MKIITINLDKKGVAKAIPIKNKFLCLTHGEEGRGRWQLRLPLAAREFPVTEKKEVELLGEYKLVDLGRKDPKGNSIFLIANGVDDGKQLILLSLSPGYRGSASYSVHGSATVKGEGMEAQGMAGRMGSAPCPLILSTGPCQINWHRSGRLYGGDADWSAVWDGSNWNIAPCHKCFYEDAALSY